MSQTTTAPTTDATSDEVDVEHFDVLVVGAGISGIGAAYHLTSECPDKSYVTLESQDSFGGTWKTHTYPGIRSDSDLFTFGYKFKPWRGDPIASADKILAYMNEVIDENDLGQHIRYGHLIESASWSSENNLWTIDATRRASGARVQFTTNFLWMCQGYYRHSKGHTPEWPGMFNFSGEIIHPQTWPDDADMTGKKVIVIGSGATAATLVPAIAEEVEHVTILQRSPTYFFPGQNVNELADTLRELDIPDDWTHEIVRRKILKDQHDVTQLCIDFPELAREELLNAVRELLPEGYDVEKHFGPRYRPWQQRIAFVPDGDIFAGISSGKVSMVTDEIDTFTENGIRTKSGEELEADIVITATGFDLCVLGDIAFSVDGDRVDFADTVTYRGMMFTGVPNMVWVFGYFRASWTLRADMISEFVCRLLHHMDETGVSRVVPTLRAEDAAMELLPWLDGENFNPGYMTRSMHLMPKRIDKGQWQHSQNYWVEKDELPAADLEDGCLVYD